MKVNNTINAANTNLAAITNRQTAAEAEKNKVGKVSFGRFDTFTKVNEPEKKTERSAEDSELIKNLDRLSDEEKAYYTFLLSENGKITGDYGKYAFADKHGGNYVSKSDVESALAEVQRRLDSMVNPEKGVGNDIYDRVFQISSNTFQAVTGITDDVLNLADESLWKLPDGLTHENFVDTIRESLKSVMNRSDQLKDLMNDYINGNLNL